MARASESNASSCQGDRDVAVGGATEADADADGGTTDADGGTTVSDGTGPDKDEDGTAAVGAFWGEFHKLQLKYSEVVLSYELHSAFE